MRQLDNIHYSFRRIDGYNKPFNMVISAREAGKSTTIFMEKIYREWKKNRSPSVYIVRNVVEISEALITTIQDNIINKFTDDNVVFQFNKGNFKDGIVDVKIEGELFIRIIALNISARRMKQTLLKNCYIMIFDEMIINQRNGEKYLKGEANKLEELYTTYKRERANDSKPLKVYLLGNPYSLYNPYFILFNVDVNKLKLGSVLVGENYVVDYYKITDELRNKILQENPMYQIDEEFKKYAFDGTPINDNNIRIGKLPNNYHLHFVFRCENQYIGVFQNNYWEDKEDRYYCSYVDESKIAKNRDIYCFEFSDLVNRCILLSNSERQKFNLFRIAMRKRQVVFSDVSVYYIVEEIYYNI